MQPGQLILARVSIEAGLDYCAIGLAEHNALVVIVLLDVVNGHGKCVLRNEVVHVAQALVNVLHSVRCECTRLALCRQPAGHCEESGAPVYCSLAA